MSIGGLNHANHPLDLGKAALLFYLPKVLFHPLHQAPLSDSGTICALERASNHLSDSEKVLRDVPDLA